VSVPSNDQNDNPGLAAVARELRRLRTAVEELEEKATPSGERLLTREEAADVLGISVRKLDELRAEGGLQAIEIGRSVRYHPDTLDRFMRRRTGGGGGR